MTTTPTIDTILADIRAGHDAAQMPDGLQPEIDAFRAAQGAQVKHLSTSLLAILLYWLHEATQRTSERAALQVALQTAHYTLAVVARGVKQRHGEDIVPGRFALAAWHFASAALDVKVEPAKLELADELLDELRTPIEVERDALREAIHRIEWAKGEGAVALSSAIADAVRLADGKADEVAA